MERQTEVAPTRGRPQGAWWAPALAVMLLTLLAAAWTVRHEFEIQHAQAASRLESIAELRATQVHGWVLDAGMNDHVAKPVVPALMYATRPRWLPLRAAARAAEIVPDTPVPAPRRRPVCRRRSR